MTSPSTLFADREFRIECNDMVLFREGDDPLVLRGPGEIWQDDDGQIQFKIFLPQVDYEALSAHLGRKRVAGKLLGDDDYFEFQAEELSGTIWFSDSVFPSTRGGLSGGLAKGTLQKLVSERELPSSTSKGSVRMRFDGKLRFPANQGSAVVKTVGEREVSRNMATDSARAESGDFSFNVRIEGKHTVVSASIPAAMNPELAEFRIRESLQFVLGREIDPLAVETYFGAINATKLLSAKFSKTKGRIQPPVRFQMVDWDDHFWNLFLSYFNYVSVDEREGWHPVSEHIGSTIQSSAASLGSEILALSVAVEGISGIVCAAGLPEKTLLEDLANVAEALKDVKINETTRNRISGALSGMKKPRNSDMLRAFVEESKIPFARFESWKRLRHAAAHGASLHGRAIEDVLVLRSEVTMLLYSLVFHAIGYSGPRIDYSVEGWPEADWPITLLGPEPVSESGTP